MSSALCPPIHWRALPVRPLTGEGRRRLDEGRLNAAMLMQVHDELVFEVAEDQLDRLAQMVIEEKPLFDAVPTLILDREFGA